MGYSLFVSVRDGKNRTSTVTANLPSTSNPAYAAAAAADLAAYIKSLSDGAVTDAGFTYHVDPASLPAGAADSHSDVEEKALFVFETELGHPTRITIPAFIESKFDAGSEKVNLTDVQVLAFTGAMISGWDTGTGEDVFPSDARDEDITALIEARKSWARARQ